MIDSKLTKLIENEIYYSNRGVYAYIFRVNTNGLGYKGYLIPSSRTFSKDSNTYIEWLKEGLYEVRLSTQEEINHLLSCEKAGKYVDMPKEVIINNYELF